MQRVVPAACRMDNWQYQSCLHHPLSSMERSLSVPQIVVHAPLAETLCTKSSSSVHFSININEDDEDCPGHGRCTLVRTMSSDSLYASSEDDYYNNDRCRAMSIDTIDGEKLDLANNNNNSSNMNDENGNGSRQRADDDDDDPESSRQTTFFNMKRRASYDNSAFGMPDRIVRGDVCVSYTERFVKTVPSTPADPSTPVGRFLSDEEMLANPEKVFQKIFDCEYMAIGLAKHWPELFDVQIYGLLRCLHLLPPPILPVGDTFRLLTSAAARDEQTYPDWS